MKQRIKEYLTYLAPRTDLAQIIIENYNILNTWYLGSDHKYGSLLVS